MGSSATAKLVYGINLGEEPRFKGIEDEDGDEDYEKRDEAEKASGASIVNYGYDFNCAILGIEIASVDWGARRLKPEDLVVDPTWEGRVRALAERLGVKLLKRHKFGLHIAAQYG